jgi:hypothetical protein
MKKSIILFILLMICMVGNSYAFPPTPPSSSSGSSSGVNTTYDANSDSKVDADKVDVWSGSITDEQLLCGENTDGTNRMKSCGAKITYTEPASNVTICRTGAAATGACTVPHKLAVFAWDGGGSALTAAAGTKRCAFVTETAVLTGLYFSTEAESTSDITVTVTKDAFAAGAHSTTAWNIISSSNVVTIPSAGTVLNVNTTSFTATAITAGDQICATITATDTTKWLQLTFYGTY